MIPSHSVEASLVDCLPAVIVDLTAGRFERVDATLQALLRAPDAQSEERFFNLCAHLQQAAQRNHHYVELLPRWRLACPDSQWPDLVACLMWEQVANQARGQGLAAEVTEANRKDADLAQAALLFTAMDLVQRHALPWVLATVLMRNVMVLGEPQWLQAWFQGELMADDLQYLGSVPGAAQARWPALGPVPALGCSAPEPLAGVMRSHPRAEGEPEGFLWLLQALQGAAVGASALQIFAQLSTPRWGGSHDEILWLADSPMAAKLDESQRNDLRLIAWLDTLDEDNVDTDEPAAVQTAFERGRQLLQLPLSVLGKASVQVRLGELSWLAGDAAQAREHFVQALAQAPTLRVEERVLVRMLHTAVATGMQAWLGQVALNSRLSSPVGAVLYGMLCDTGWCGVQHDPAIARQWYACALDMGPMPEPEGLCPFNDLYYAFDESVQATALRPMVEYAASRGVPEMQFAWASLHEDSDPLVALQAYRQAGAHGFSRALYNLSAVCDRGVEAGGLPGMDVQTLREMGNDAELDCLGILMGQEQITTRAYNRALNCFLGLGSYLADHRVDSPRVRRNLAMLEAFAAGGWPEPMRVLVEYYRTEDCPLGDQYPRAVYWCEQACQVEPDSAEYQALRESLSSGLLGGMRYRRALAKAQAEYS
ncbi:DUF4034 domain-containing protein [Pseudomonas sp. SC11]|uniref:DUF4034 domain-containing protein n=1 Tax=Pseudomonas sp. SC11 TaxID=326927 RepID=UPI00399BE957